MRLTSAGGFFIVLLSVMVVQGQKGWGVTYTSTNICALKGSSVTFSCTFKYPPKINTQNTTVTRTLWFARLEDNKRAVDLKDECDSADRVQYVCDENHCALTISDLRQSDSAEYRFRFITNHPGGGYSGSSGVCLSVTDLQVHVSSASPCTDDTCVQAELRCQSSCHLPHQYKYIWFKNGKEIHTHASSSYLSYIYPTDTVSCAVEGYEMFSSPSVSLPMTPSVSYGPSGDITEGSSVTLTCSSDANPPVTKYTWYKKNIHTDQEPVSGNNHLVFDSIQSSDSGTYYCTAKNEVVERASAYIRVDVKYPPRFPFVSVSPSGQIVEGSSVTLTCCSDANPPVTKYTWYKENIHTDQEPVSGNNHLVFDSIQSSDSGTYYCTAKNEVVERASAYIRIGVKYPPRHPSVSVRPPGQIVEGSSVTLICTSDANPTARYTWYKENEDSPTASGQNFTITDFRSEHNGNYYCEAQNSRGRQNSTTYLVAASVETKIIVNIVKLSLLVLLLSALIFSTLRFRKKKSQHSHPEVTPLEPIELDPFPIYENIFTATETQEA